MAAKKTTKKATQRKKFLKKRVANKSPDPKGKKAAKKTTKKVTKKKAVKKYARKVSVPAIDKFAHVEPDLGHEIVDIVTGFKGIVTGKTYFLNGCVRLSVDPPVKKTGEMRENQWFDIQQLRVINPSPPARQIVIDREAAATSTGGPRDDAVRRKDCPR